MDRRLVAGISDYWRAHFAVRLTSRLLPSPPAQARNRRSFARGGEAQGDEIE